MTSESLERRIQRRFLSLLVATPQGRAHLLGQIADAEDSEEGRVFDILEARVDDPELKKMIRIHQADERRHGQRFRECVARTGIDPGPVRPELRLFNRLEAHLGDSIDWEVKDPKGVMEMYLLLQVIEERAITQFRILMPLFQAVDPQTGAVFAEVARDEERHLKYCRAISKRYAPDELTRAQTLRRLRAVEAKAYADNGRANMLYALDHGLVAARPLERVFFRGLARVSERLGRQQRTPFWGEAA